jgi:hypothetical protein
MLVVVKVDVLVIITVISLVPTIDPSDAELVVNVTDWLVDTLLLTVDVTDSKVSPSVVNLVVIAGESVFGNWVDSVAETAVVCVGIVVAWEVLVMVSVG